MTMLLYIMHIEETLNVTTFSQHCLQEHHFLQFKLQEKQQLFRIIITRATEYFYNVNYKSTNFFTIVITGGTTDLKETTTLSTSILIRLQSARYGF